MTEAERLKHIAKLFGGSNKLSKEIGLDGSGVSRRIQGETKITDRDWICVRAAIERRIAELQAALNGERPATTP